MIIKDSVLAVIVSYNGGATISACVQALLEQVGKVLIVDNCSNSETRNVIRQLRCNYNFDVIWLDKNIGIAGALNVGLHYALTGGYAWLLTMDQDSIPASNMVDCYLECLNAHPHIASFTPNVDALGQSASSSGSHVLVSYAITSGNMVSTKAASDVGGFDTELFIDGVDFDFSLKLKQKNYQILRVLSASMSHSLGEFNRDSNLILKSFYTNHPPFRTYYMFRNLVTISKRYYRDFPYFIFKLLFVHILYITSVLINGPNRMKSLSAALSGLRDSLFFLKGIRNKF